MQPPKSHKIFYFWKGRVALYAILKALNITKGDEIILPAFTCVVVPNAIAYLGAKPVYVDIDPYTYNIDASQIESKITSKARAIMAQNTFGLSSDLDPLREIAESHECFLIEDCAHGFGGTYKGHMNGTVADAAFYSSQWNKPFSTGLGGFAITKNEDIAKKLKILESKAVVPSFKEQFSLKLQLFARDYLVNEFTYWQAMTLYRVLSKFNIITGSSQGYELESTQMPDDFFKGFSDIQRKRFKKELQRIDQNLAHRKKISQKYKEILFELGKGVPLEPDYATHTFCKFPLLVTNRNEFLKFAEKNRIEVGDWFNSPIHPVTENLTRWDYKWGENPIAEYMSQHMVNLHTHQGITENCVKRTNVFLKEFSDMIIPYEKITL